MQNGGPDVVSYPSRAPYMDLQTSRRTSQQTTKCGKTDTPMRDARRASVDAHWFADHGMELRKFIDHCSV